MLAPALPKTWLVHSIEYREKGSGRDEYGNPVLASPVTINNVRFDYNSTYTRDITQNIQSLNGVIFVDSKHSYPIPSTNFVENSEIVFNGRTSVIHKVVICYHPESSQIHHYELEVV